MAQVTLVSLYGEKKSALATLIAQCQELVTNAVGAAFTPYDIRQIHATITGLEALVGPPAYNANFAKYRGRDVVMDFDGFFAYLRVSIRFLLRFRLAGLPIAIIHSPAARRSLTKGHFRCRVTRL